MIDILLIAPQNKTQVFQQLVPLVALEPPTYMLLVAQYLRQKGLSVQVIDGQFFTFEEIAKETEYLNPILVGVYVYGNQPSSSTHTMPAARETCQEIKNNNSNRKILISGTHPAALPKQTLLEEPVDFVCDREGFKTILDLVKCLSTNDDIYKVPDLWFKQKNIINFTYRDKLLTENEMNQIGIPAWDLVEHNEKLDHYRCHNWHNFNGKNRSPYASIYTTLGCPLKCNFCCINAPFGNMHDGSPRPYRFFSPDIVTKQIETLVYKYGISNIKFVDEMFVLNKKHIFGITDNLIKNELGKKINIWAYARVDSAKPEFLDPLKRAGFNWLCLGIECGNRDVRETANKMKLEYNDIINVVKRIHNAGIYIIGNYIFGLPEDNKERMQQTYDLACELNCEFSNFYSAMAYPGSPLYKMALEANFDLPKSWERFSQHSYETYPLRNHFLLSAEILQFRDEKHLEYHSRSKYQQMIFEKFGQRALDEIKLMLSLGAPKRKILEN